MLVRLVLAFALLLVPTTLMGATLPTLSKAVAHRLERVGGDMGRLYAANTLGAAAGCAVAAFFALEHLGVSGTTYAAAAGNLIIALVAYRWSRDGQQEQPGVETGCSAHHVRGLAGSWGDLRFRGLWPSDMRCCGRGFWRCSCRVPPPKP